MNESELCGENASEQIISQMSILTAAHINTRTLSQANRELSSSVINSVWPRGIGQNQNGFFSSQHLQGCQYSLISGIQEKPQFGI